jgi:hypothetical protein
MRGKVVPELIACATDAGHEIVNWRCKYCLRTLQEIFRGGRPEMCQSPDQDNRFLFLGGPMHGEWIHVPPESGGHLRTTWHVMVRRPMRAKAWQEDNVEEGPTTEEFQYLVHHTYHDVGNHKWWPMIVYAAPDLIERRNNA